MNHAAMLNQKFGVEVEMYNISRAKAAQVVAESLTRQIPGARYHVDPPTSYLDCRKIRDILGQNPTWQIESDSSIRASCGQERTELVSPILDWSDMPVLQQVLRDLRAAGAKSTPKHSCGIHVHVDGSGHTAESLRNLTNLMASHEALLWDALAVSEGRRTWCQPVDPVFLCAVNAARPRTLADLKDVWYRSHGTPNASHYDNSRYHMLNLHSFFEGKGIEFRMFQFDDFYRSGVSVHGSIHAGQLKAYVQLCLAMSQAAKDAARVNPRPVVTDNPKYAMRCWLLRLGFIGPEYEVARRLFIKRLAGDASWRHGRPAAKSTTGPRQRAPLAPLMRRPDQERSLSMYYLAYGSNLNLRQMRLRCPGSRRVGTAWLDGYRLVFRGSGTGAYLSVDRAPGCRVPCGVFRITSRDEASLDRYEGYPGFYGKKIVEVELVGLNGVSRGAVNAMVYALPEDAPLGAPSEWYCAVCAQGYRDFGLDLRHLREALVASGSGHRRGLLAACSNTPGIYLLG